MFQKSNHKAAFYLAPCNQISEDQYPSYLRVSIVLYETVILKDVGGF